jgi:hypothetical protein
VRRNGYGAECNGLQEWRNECYWRSRHPLCPTCYVLWEARGWALPLPPELIRHRNRMAGAPVP